jgi:hypothetical protein
MRKRGPSAVGMGVPSHLSGANDSFVLTVNWKKTMLTIAHGVLPLTCVLVLTAARLAAGVGQPPPVVPLNKVRDHVGRRVTACARVVSYGWDSKEGSIVFDLQKPYWLQDVGILLLEADRPSFAGDIVDRYLAAEVCATGVVERRKGRRLIRITQPADWTYGNSRPQALHL